MVNINAYALEGFLVPLWKELKNKDFKSAVEVYFRRVRDLGGAESSSKFVFFKEGPIIGVVRSELKRSFSGFFKEIEKNSAKPLVSGKGDTNHRKFLISKVDGYGLVYLKIIKDKSDYLSPIHELFLGSVFRTYSGVAWNIAPKPYGVVEVYDRLYVITEALEGYIPLSNLSVVATASKIERYNRLLRLAKFLGRLIAGLHIARVVDNGERAILFFHGDLHPGNVMVKVNVEEKRRFHSLVPSFIDWENAELVVLSRSKKWDEELVVKLQEKRVKEVKKFLNPNSDVSGPIAEMKLYGVLPVFVEAYLEVLEEKGDILQSVLPLKKSDFKIWFYF